MTATEEYFYVLCVSLFPKNNFFDRFVLRMLSKCMAKVFVWRERQECNRNIVDSGISVMYFDKNR